MKMYLGVSVGFSAMVLVVGGCHSVHSLCLASLDRIEGFGHDSSSKDGESIQISYCAIVGAVLWLSPMGPRQMQCYMFAQWP